LPLAARSPRQADITPPALLSRAKRLRRSITGRR